MKHGTVKACLLVAGLWAGAACAQLPLAADRESVRALRVYRMTTQRMLVACSEAIAPRRGVRSAAEALHDYRGCAARALEDSGTRLEAVVRTLAAPDPVRALREYHLAFTRALTGLQPQPDERSSAYEERQAYLFHRLAHAWARFELADAATR
ncbi:MAG TPA: hypothetical protein VFM98_07545 [Ramlibacter sp.]|uniref:hypothetical protein n=1 Tax=Ramlibacter sp. TaxID=1917967 RepID=UPI002D7F5259|nr:hypothetical protein [Ramlibacter sp.]HET8745442.1 hypothetical protein [Ramlibacter sp.]